MFIVRLPGPKRVTVASRNNLQAQLSSVSDSSSASYHEVNVLKQRVDDTEREKRDLIVVISRLKEDANQRDGMHILSMSMAYTSYSFRGNPYITEQCQTSASGMPGFGEPGSGTSFS